MSSTRRDRSEGAAAVFAVHGIGVVAFGAALGAALGGDRLPAGLECEFIGDDTGRYGNDCVAEDHQHRGQGLASGGLGCDIAVADGGDCDNRPVDAMWDTAETVLLAFDKIHEGTDDNDDIEHGEEEDGDLAAARLQRLQQELRLAEIMRQLEDAEDT